MKYIPFPENVNSAFYNKDLEEHFEFWCRCVKRERKKYHKMANNIIFDKMINYLVTTGRPPIFYCEFGVYQYCTYTAAGRDSIMRDIKRELKKAYRVYVMYEKMATDFELLKSKVALAKDAECENGGTENA